MTPVFHQNTGGLGAPAGIAGGPGWAGERRARNGALPVLEQILLVAVGICWTFLDVESMFAFSKSQGLPNCCQQPAKCLQRGVDRDCAVC